MWVQIKAVDGTGTVFFQDGVLNGNGHLDRTNQTKVYEQKIKADGYPTSVIAEGDEEFHFVLMNKIEKDNRIPPKGFNKAGYTADGAFIITHDPNDTDYPDGQNWDDTQYTIPIPGNLPKGNVKIFATLYYQTFNKEYVEFLNSHDDEPTVANGGRARNLPAAGKYAAQGYWGKALHQLWKDVDNGRPVDMGQAKAEIQMN